MPDFVLKAIIATAVAIIVICILAAIKKRLDRRVMRIDVVDNRIRVRWFAPKEEELGIILGVLTKGMEANKRAVLNSDFLDELDKLCAKWHDLRRERTNSMDADFNRIDRILEKLEQYKEAKTPCEDQQTQDQSTV